MDDPFGTQSVRIQTARHHHPDGDGHMDRIAVDRLDGGDGLPDPLRDPAGPLAGIMHPQQDDELIPAQAGQNVLATQHGARAVGRFLEQHVTLRMPEPVIDLLEPVQIEVEHGDGRVRAPGMGACLLEFIEQRCPVGQPGQAILQGHLLHVIGVLGKPGLAVVKTTDQARHIGRDRRIEQY